jgi:chemotaxis protein methyltransferase CheR
MRWPGFRKVRGQVCKRISRRLQELQLPDLESYRIYLESTPREWNTLDSLCRITISRFYRNKGTFDLLQTTVLPELIESARQFGEKDIFSWCIGSASGEEPYTLSLLWDLSGINRQGLNLRITATEVDQLMINRAKKGCYPESSIRELPPEMKTRGFAREDELFCINEQHKTRVHFLQQDIRDTQPDAIFHLILCRNLVFTYFSRELQEEIIRKILLCLKPGGALVIGTHESLPGLSPDLAPWNQGQSIYCKKE